MYMRNMLWVFVILLSTTLSAMITEESYNSNQFSENSIIPKEIQEIIKTNNTELQKQLIRNSFEKALTSRVEGRKNEDPQLLYIQKDIPKQHWPKILCYDYDHENAPYRPDITDNGAYMITPADFSPKNLTLSVTLDPKVVFLLPYLTNQFATQIEHRWNQLAQPNNSQATSWCLKNSTKKYVAWRRRYRQFNIAVQNLSCCCLPCCAPCCVIPATLAKNKKIINEIAQKIALELYVASVEHDLEKTYSLYALRHFQEHLGEKENASYPHKKPLEMITDMYMNYHPNVENVQNIKDIQKLYEKCNTIPHYTFTNKEAQEKAVTYYSQKKKDKDVVYNLD